MYKISAYSYVLWGNRYRIPYREMIKSVLPAVDEFVIVTDPRFADGTLEDLIDMHNKIDCKIKVYHVRLDLDDPGIDGKTKALARSKCRYEVCLQVDADEIVREQDLNKFQLIAKEVFKNNIIVGTGVVNWFNGDNLKWSAAGWTKERFSPNSDRITHGIPYNKRILVERDPPGSGCYFGAIENESDGAGYIDRQGKGVCSSRILCDLKHFKRDYQSKDSFYIHHYSWYDLPRKWSMNTTWRYFWGLLYGKYQNLDDYELKTGSDFWCPSVIGDPKQYIPNIVKEMKQDRSIKAAPKYIKHPEIMQDWLDNSMVYVPRMVTRGIFRGYSKNM